MLFDISAKKPKYARKTSTGIRTEGYSRFLRGKSLKELESSIGTLQDGDTVAYATGGQWSLHEIMEYCLRQAGPSQLYLTTWALSEDPVRLILALKDEGLITGLHCLFDHRIRNNASGAYSLLTELCDKHKLTRIHAKTLVIIPDNAGLYISVLTSANLTNNKRIEIGTVITGKPCAMAMQSWIEEELEGKQPFMR